ncbi:MAG: DUF192 domain-containing protein [Patescibacteria group bacterium]
MKKINKIYLIALVLFLALSVFLLVQNKVKTIDYKVAGQSFKLLVADSTDEWVNGLMNVRELKNADGMMFVFPDKKRRTFWNKNTYLDLYVYWILNDEVVGRDFLPSIEKSKRIVYVSSPVPVDKVAEIIRK